MTDKIIESFFFLICIQPLTMTQTQEIINHRLQRFMNGYAGMCMSGEKFLKE